MWHCGPALFFCFLRKCHDGNHLKFVEALHFYIHPSFGQKNTFSSHSYTFSSKSDDFVYNFYRNGNFPAKKDYFYLEKKTFMLKWCFLAPFCPPKKDCCGPNRIRFTYLDISLCNYHNLIK